MLLFVLCLLAHPFRRQHSHTNPNSIQLKHSAFRTFNHSNSLFDVSQQRSTLGLGRLPAIDVLDFADSLEEDNPDTTIVWHTIEDHTKKTETFTFTIPCKEGNTDGYHFSNVQFLASGSFGRVYRAKYTARDSSCVDKLGLTINTFYAMKVLGLNYYVAEDIPYIATVLMEPYLLGFVQKVTAYTVWEDNYKTLSDGNSYYIFIFSQLFTGGDIDSAIAAKEYSKASKAVEDAWKEYDEKMKPIGLVHGDLKPENLMIDSSGNGHVVDLGLSFFIGEISSSDLEKSEFTLVLSRAAKTHTQRLLRDGADRSKIRYKTTTTAAELVSRLAAVRSADQVTNIRDNSRKPGNSAHHAPTSWYKYNLNNPYSGAIDYYAFAVSACEARGMSYSEGMAKVEEILAREGLTAEDTPANEMERALALLRSFNYAAMS